MKKNNTELSIGKRILNIGLLITFIVSTFVFACLYALAQGKVDSIAIQYIGHQMATSHLLEKTRELIEVSNYCEEFSASISGKHICTLEEGGLVICTLFSLEGKEKILRLKCTQW